MIAYTDLKEKCCIIDGKQVLIPMPEQIDFSYMSDNLYIKEDKGVIVALYAANKELRAKKLNISQLVEIYIKDELENFLKENKILKMLWKLKGRITIAPPMGGDFIKEYIFTYKGLFKKAEYIIKLDVALLSKL